MKIYEKILISRTNQEGERYLTSTNESIRKNIFILNKLINDEIQTENIQIKRIQNKFGNALFTFSYSFWKFDSFTEALRDEVNKYFINEIADTFDEMEKLEKESEKYDCFKNQTETVSICSEPEDFPESEPFVKNENSFDVILSSLNLEEDFIDLEIKNLNPEFLK